MRQLRFSRQLRVYHSSQALRDFCRRFSGACILVDIPPYASVLAQGLIGIAFVFLGQAGTSVKGAYDVLVSIGVITYLVPYLLVFAALVRMQREPAGAEVVFVPGGKPAAIFVAGVGFCTTTFAILLSLIPSPEEPHKILVVVKVLGAASVLIGLGALVYLAGKSKRRSTPEFDAATSEE